MPFQQHGWIGEMLEAAAGVFEHIMNHTFAVNG